MFSDDVRPSTYVTNVQVDAICKKVADKYGLEGMPKIAYGMAVFEGANSTVTVDLSSAGFTSPPVIVAVPVCDYVLNYNRDVLQVTWSKSTSSANFLRANAQLADLPVYWMAMGT